jgi:hypothetical protein
MFRPQTLKVWCTIKKRALISQIDFPKYDCQQLDKYLFLRKIIGTKRKETIYVQVLETDPLGGLPFGFGQSWPGYGTGQARPGGLGKRQ